MPLDFNRATNGLNGTREFRNKAVTSAAENSTSVVADQRTDPIMAQTESANRAFLVERGKAAKPATSVERMLQAFDPIECSLLQDGIARPDILTL